MKKSLRRLFRGRIFREYKLGMMVDDRGRCICMSLYSGVVRELTK